VTVEREIALDAPPEEVWAELDALFDDDGDRDRVIEFMDPPRHLSFWWAPAADDEPPSHVDIELVATGTGTLLHVRETRLDGAHLVRSAFSARARA